MQVPDDLRYTQEHEWIRSEPDGRIRVGITDYAQDSLGDVVFVSLPEVGRVVEGGAMLAEVESTKSVAEVYAPLAGTVVGINDLLSAQPELVNQDPYGQGWFVEIAIGDASGVEQLLDAVSYRSLTE
jgi:glycine cleavage system H protein